MSGGPRHAARHLRTPYTVHRRPHFCCRLAGGALYRDSAARLSCHDSVLQAEVNPCDSRARRAGHRAGVSLHVVRLAVSPAVPELRNCSRYVHTGITTQTVVSKVPQVTRRFVLHAGPQDTVSMATSGTLWSARGVGSSIQKEKNACGILVGKYLLEC